MKIYFNKDNGPIDKLIQELIGLLGDIPRPEIVREMILASLKAGQEDDGAVDLKLMNTSLKEMRFTAKAFGPYRHTRKVAVFGSARTLPEETIYKMAISLGQKLAELEYMAITGGGPGIMQAVHEGAGSEYSFGVNIRLPFEQKSNPVIEGNPRSITYKYFFNRKVAFLKESDAIVVFQVGSVRSMRGWRPLLWCKQVSTILYRFSWWMSPGEHTGVDGLSSSRKRFSCRAIFANQIWHCLRG